MLRIAIVEDDASARDVLSAHLTRFEAEEKTAYTATYYSDAVAFLDAYRPDFDVVFMDVEMPYLLGTDAAALLRKKDRAVMIVFITNMAQYAIKGYEVDAVDYILKPVSYYRFAAMLKKIHSRVQASERMVDIRTPDGLRRIAEREILFVQIEDHLLLYHTENGVIESWDTLKKAEETLSPERFAKIGKNCLIGLSHIASVSGDTVTVGGETFPISRRQKKTFLAALNRFLAR